MVRKMINKFYFKSKTDKIYYLPLYSRGWFWLLIIFLVAWILWFFRRSNLWLLIQFLDIVFIVLYCIYFSVINGSFINWCKALKIKNRINSNLLRERVKRGYPVQLQMPGISVIFNRGKLNIKINKLSDMRDSDLDVLRQIIDSSLVRRYGAYAVTALRINDTGNYYQFWAEKVGVNQALNPQRMDDFRQKPYFVQLQKDLKINLADTPHIAVWGASGTGKTTVLLAIIAQCLSNGTNLFFIDGKQEFSSLSEFYPKNKIVSDNKDVLAMLEKICEKAIPIRQKIVAKAVKSGKYQGFGLRGYDIGLRPLVIVADEVGSIVVGFDNKSKKLFDSYLTQIAQKGRSISVFLVVASQSPATDVLPQGVRSQFSTRILLGTANSDIQRMAFGQSFDVGQVDRFTGYYLTDGVITPQKYWVPNLTARGLLTVKSFEKLYLGKAKSSK